MKKEYAELLSASCQNGMIRVREDYSGRYMYGEKTTAIIYPSDPILMEAIAKVAASLVREEDLEFIRSGSVISPESVSQCEAFSNAMTHLRFDSMGLDLIAY